MTLAPAPRPGPGRAGLRGEPNRAEPARRVPARLRLVGGTVLAAAGWARAASRYHIEAPAGVSAISVATSCLPAATYVSSDRLGLRRLG
jgi:hypothetical protein